MIRSFAALERVDPGFVPRGVLSMAVSVAGTAGASRRGGPPSTGRPSRRSAAFRESCRRARSTISRSPETSGAGPSRSPAARSRAGREPGRGLSGRPPGLLRDDGDSASARPGHRGFRRLERSRRRRHQRGSAKKHWPGEDPIGQRITFDDQDKNPYWLTVIGVSKNAVRGRWGAVPEGEVYLAYLQHRRYLEAPSTPT